MEQRSDKIETQNQLDNHQFIETRGNTAAPKIDGNASIVQESVPTPSLELPPIRQIRGISWAILIGSLASANFLVSMDNTIVADVQAPIIEDFREVDKLPWISVAFELGAASANLFWYVQNGSD